MELNYNFKIKTTEVRSAFKEADSSIQSDVYLNKKHGWLNYKIDFNTDTDLIFESEIFEKTKLNNKTIFKVNTLNVLITNIIVEGIPYFYKLNIVSSKNTKESIKLDLDLKDMVEYNNNLYTNEEFYSIISENEYVYTSKVIDLSDCTCIFRSNLIEIEAPFNSEIKLLSDKVISPKIINQYSFYLPSFYIKNSENKIIQCIDSDIKIFESKIQTKFGDYLKYKIEKSLEDTNILKDFNLNLEKEIKTCYFRLSSHCFSTTKIEEYFIIESDGTIKTGYKDNYTFKIYKDIDVENIEVIPNTYKNLDLNYKDLRGFFVNSFVEVDDSINSFGIVYNKIDNMISNYNYINNISFTPFKLKKNPKLKSKMLKDNATIFKVLEETSTRNYTECDNINYFIKE